jgi:hypothetical protein
VTADGRHIDPELGALTGEGSLQKIDTTSEAYPTKTSVWRDLPSHSYQEAEPTYYGRPALKEPVWIWTVPPISMSAARRGRRRCWRPPPRPSTRKSSTGW